MKVLLKEKYLHIKGFHFELPCEFRISTKNTNRTYILQKDECLYNIVIDLEEEIDEFGNFATLTFDVSKMKYENSNTRKYANE